jgi:hypothetical protein
MCISDRIFMFPFIKLIVQNYEIIKTVNISFLHHNFPKIQKVIYVQYLYIRMNIQRDICFLSLKKEVLEEKWMKNIFGPKRHKVKYNW